MSTSPVQPQAQPSRFSINQDLIRKKSKSTFKLFTSLTSNARQQPANPTPSGIPRPRSNYTDYINGLETQNHAIHFSSSSSSSASSIKSQLSLESRLTLQSLASTQTDIPPLNLSRFAMDTSVNQPRYFSVSQLILCRLICFLTHTHIYSQVSIQAELPLMKSNRQLLEGPKIPCQETSIDQDPHCVCVRTHRPWLNQVVDVLPWTVDTVPSPQSIVKDPRYLSIE